MEGEIKNSVDEQKKSVLEEESETQSKKIKTSKSSSKLSLKEAYATSTSTMISYSSKTYESKTTMMDGSLIPAVSAISNVKMVYQSGEDIVNPVRERKTGSRSASEEGGASVSGFGGFGGFGGLGGLGNFPCAAMFSKRSPFIHNPPTPEVPRARIEQPRCPKDYIINLREDLADFQESRGLPRTRDYSFLSLGLALAHETARTICSLFLMFAELFPILAVISLILRFALDKIIEILETPEPGPKLKKAIIFGLQMLVILIPLWILIGTIVLPLIALVFSIIQRILRIKGGKKKSIAKPKPKIKASYCQFF